MKHFFSLKNIIIGLGIIIIDLFVYIFLGLMLMDYDDFYDESKGAYFSLESMTFWQKVTYISLHFWYVINIIFIVFLVYKLIVKVKKIKSERKIVQDSKRI